MNKIDTLAATGNIANIVIVIGVDLAKNVFALHGVNAAGKPILVRPCVRRDQLLEILAQLPPCVIGMEACTGAHHWARELIKFGHTPKLMAPKFVAPYRMQGKRGKNDANDAAAICEAATRPNMRFVPIKSEDAQATLTVHRVRQGFIEERTATINRVRGLMSEFGVVLAKKADTVRRAARSALEHLPGWANRAVTDLLGHIATLDQRIAEYDTHLRQLAGADERAKRLMRIPGVGPTTATALLAAMATTSKMVANSPPGLAWCRANMAQAASPGWATSPRQATAISEPC
jgi:transposase